MGIAKKGERRWDGSDPFQPSLFLSPDLIEVPTFNPFPSVARSYEGFLRVLAGADEDWGLGYDLEFSGSRPTILGISNRSEAASIKWTNEAAQKVIDSGLPLVGHSIHGAEKRITEGALGIKLPVSRFRDSMLLHYLVNADLTKAPDKAEEEGEGGGAGGFMNIWTASNLYTDAWCWKDCRGNSCLGPCPVHDVFSYNGVDAWASPAIFQAARREMTRKNIPMSEYDHLMRLAQVAEEMQMRGVKVDKERSLALDVELDRIKESLFPVEGRLFNPRSSQQILAYFGSKGVHLEDTDKKTVEKVLDRECKRAEIDRGRLDKMFHDLPVDEYLQDIDKLPEHIRELHLLHCFKSQGKSTKPWFDDKYVDRQHLVHARFNPIGACTGRFSSSGPNFQNLPARGWGEKVREAITPREKGLIIAKADYSQLELRICLYLAGVDPNDIGGDAFIFLVNQAEGAFDQAAARYSGSARDIAKSVSHGGDYLEGIQVLTPRELESPRIKKEIASGARAVYLRRFGADFDWQFMGGIVSFTGANLAERLFGSRSLEHRKMALEIQEGIYFRRFQSIRRWQKSVTDYIEVHHSVRNPAGRVLDLFGSPEEMAKHGVATLGQGTGARYANGITVRYAEERGQIPLLLVHDERVDELPADWTPAQILDFYRLMSEEIPELPGFTCPTKVKAGANWGACKEIKWQ